MIATELALDAVRPAPENDRLYRPVLASDPEMIIALAVSIREHGLREPLVLSTDRYILSGHRRYAAAGLAAVPVRYEAVCRAADPDRSASDVALLAGEVAVLGTITPTVVRT